MTPADLPILLLPAGLIVFAIGAIALEERQRDWGRAVALIGCVAMIAGGFALMGEV